MRGNPPVMGLGMNTAIGDVRGMASGTGPAWPTQGEEFFLALRPPGVRGDSAPALLPLEPCAFFVADEDAPVIGGGFFLAGLFLAGADLFLAEEVGLLSTAVAPPLSARAGGVLVSAATGGAEVAGVLPFF